MPETRPKFLIIDGNVDSRFLLAKTLKRKFPGATMLECQTSESAVAFLSGGKFDAIIAHRTDDVDGATVIRMLRAINPTIPIVMVSGIDRREASRMAGATAFLHYDEWLRIGSVVDDLLKTSAAADVQNSERMK